MDKQYIWATLDGLFKTIHRQGRRVEELEARIADLERRLERGAASLQQQTTQLYTINEVPAERAA